MDRDSRLDMRSSINAAATDIESYKVQPVSNQCMEDFPTMDDPGIDTTEIDNDHRYGPLPKELPINYYDNDDGFWDNYIDHKRTRGLEAGFMVKRPCFTH